MANSQQAWENREYVRRLLKERQPEFAAALKLAEQELSARCYFPSHCGSLSSSLNRGGGPAFGKVGSAVERCGTAGADQGASGVAPGRDAGRARVPPEEVFAAIAVEVGQLLQVDSVSLCRYDPGGMLTFAELPGQADHCEN